MAQSSIEWTDATWNPVTGCTKISEGCRFCYAERMSLRLKAMGQANYQNGFELTLQPGMLDRPLTWKKPKMVFVNSMSDLFHKDVPEVYIEQVFDVMRRAHWHEFQVLTKRSDRIAKMSPQLDWPPNVWMGVSVEDRRVISRIDGVSAAPTTSATKSSPASSNSTNNGRWTRNRLESRRKLSPLAQIIGVARRPTRKIRSYSKGELLQSSTKG